MNLVGGIPWGGSSLRLFRHGFVQVRESNFLSPFSRDIHYVEDGRRIAISTLGFNQISSRLRVARKGDDSVSLGTVKLVLDEHQSRSIKNGSQRGQGVLSRDARADISFVNPIVFRGDGLGWSNDEAKRADMG
jgi:hypothetical protein